MPHGPSVSPKPTARPATLVLMGLRGSGKSTLGRLVAARAGAEFIDLDDLAAGLLGTGTLAELWARHGEARFRDAEAKALAGLELGRAGLAPRVVALGGGTPTAPGAADLLRECERAGAISLVYLRASPDTLRARLAPIDTAARPSLTGKGTLEEIELVFAARDPLYLALATCVVDVEGCPAPDLVRELAALIEAPDPPPGPPGRTP